MQEQLFFKFSQAFMSATITYYATLSSARPGFLEFPVRSKIQYARGPVRKGGGECAHHTL